MNVYLLLVHQYTSHLPRLVDALGSGVYVHACRSREPLDRLIRQRLGVATVSKRFRGNWGGFGIVEATVEGLRQVLAENAGCTHVTLLSGADFPVKPRKDYENHLQAHPGRSFVKYWDLYPFDGPENDPQNPWHATAHIQKLRLTRYYFDAFGRRYSVPPVDSQGYMEFSSPVRRLKHYLKYGGKAFTGNRREELFQLRASFRLSWPRPVPAERIYGGSQWWTLCREHAQYVVDTHDREPGLREFFRHTMLPDEMYFQTILLNGPFRDRIVNDNLRYIRFPAGSSHPLTLTMADYDTLRTGTAFFARKFDGTESLELIEQLKKHVL